MAKRIVKTRPNTRLAPLERNGTSMYRHDAHANTIDAAMIPKPTLKPIGTPR